MSMTRAALAVLMLASPATARDLGQWEGQPPEVREWYRNAELTDEAHARLSHEGYPWKKCCDHADVFRTRFRVDKATGADEWLYLVDGQWKRIPPDIVHVNEHAPDGQPTLFIYNGKETCFFPGDGGI